MSIKFKKNLLYEIFYFLSASLALAIFFELIWPNSVLSYVNLNYLIALGFISWLSLL